MKLDKRTIIYKKLSLWFNRYTLSAFVWGILVGCLLMLPYTDSKLRPSKPLETMIKPEVAEVKAWETPCDYSPLVYLRCRGQELGIDDYTITKIINMLQSCENKTLNPEAININNDKTMDVGIFQINMYWHRNEVKLVDMLDFKKNIDFGYKLFLKQGFAPWTCAKRLGLIN